MESKTTRWTFFFRAERRLSSLKGLSYEEYWAKKGASFLDVELPEDTDLVTALASAIENGAPRGSFRSGIFEVQNSLGIWSHKNEKRITPGDKNVSFQTWEDLDNETMSTHYKCE